MFLNYMRKINLFCHIKQRRNTNIAHAHSLSNQKNAQKSTESSKFEKYEKKMQKNFSSIDNFSWKSHFPSVISNSAKKR